MTKGNAEQLGELLSAYLDGELDERDSQRAAGILRQDPQARQLYTDLKRTRELVHALPRHAAPTSIASDVLARLERSALLPAPDAKPLVRRSRRSWWRAPLSLAAVLALFLGGWWAISLSPSDSLNPFARNALLPDRQGVLETTLAEKSAGDTRTVEAKLAAGVALAALQQHPFANEPVRLRLVVDSDRERDEVLRKLSKRFAAANIPDLAADAAKKQSPMAKPTDAIFFYRGKQSVNFAEAETEQVLVRASPRQVQNVLKEVEHVARRDDQLVLQAGPLQLPGRKSISVLQDFADAASVQSKGEATLADASAGSEVDRADRAKDTEERAVNGEDRAASARGEPPSATGASAPATSRDTDGAAPAEKEAAKPRDEEAARFVQELLAAAGIESEKLASAEGARRREAGPRTRSGGDTTVSGPTPAPATRERTLRSQPESMTTGNRESSTPALTRPSIGSGNQPLIADENHLTFILEVRTKPASPKPVPPGRVRVTPTPAPKPHSDATRSNSYISS